MEMQGEQLSDVTEKHHIFRAFRHRNFALFFSGHVVSMLGTWSQSLAISWLVWRITGSPVWLGITTFAIQFPMFLFGLPAGVLADRYERKFLLMILQAACMIQAAILAVLTMTGTVEIWHVLTLSILLGAIYSVEFPARQAFIMDMVGRSDILNAVALNSAVFNASRALGPAVAGWIVATMGEGVCFLFNASTYVFIMIMISMIDRKKLLPVDRNGKSVIHSIMEGLRYISKDRKMKEAITIVCIISSFAMPVLYLLPIFADVVFGGGSIHLGFMMGATGLGSLTGCLFLARRRTTDGIIPLATRSLIIASMCLIAFSFSTNIVVAISIMALFGFFMSISMSSAMTAMQCAAPDALRGRMMSLYTMAFMGFGPFGSIVAGFAANEFGAPATTAVSGVLCALATIVVYVTARNRT